MANDETKTTCSPSTGLPPKIYITARAARLVAERGANQLKVKAERFGGDAEYSYIPALWHKPEDALPSESKAILVCRYHQDEGAVRTGIIHYSKEIAMLWNDMVADSTSELKQPGDFWHGVTRWAYLSDLEP